MAIYLFLQKTYYSHPEQNYHFFLIIQDDILPSSGLNCVASITKIVI